MTHWDDGGVGECFAGRYCVYWEASVRTSFFSFGQKARVYKTFTPSHRPDRVDRGAEEESDGWSASIFNFMFLLLNEYTLFFLPVIKMRCSMLCNVKRLNSVR